MRNVYVKWTDDFKGTIKGGKYDGRLVKCTDVGTYVLEVFDRGWCPVYDGDNLEELKYAFEQWLNN